MQIIKMDFQSQSTPPVVPVMQSDAQSRFIGIALYDGGAPYSAPENAAYTVQYHGPGPNNIGWYDTITLSSGTRKAVTVDSTNKNIITLELAEQALRVNGNVFINLCVVTSTGYMLHTFPILCRVTGAAYVDPVAVRSFFYVTGITSEQWLAYVTACQDAQKRAEAAAATFETDPTLSVSGKSADAAKVGTALAEETTRAKAAEEENAKGIGSVEEDLDDAQMRIMGVIRNRFSFEKIDRVFICDIPFSGSAGNEYRFKVIASTPTVNISNGDNLVVYLMHDDKTYETVKTKISVGDEVTYIPKEDFSTIRYWFYYKDFSETFFAKTETTVAQNYLSKFVEQLKETIKKYNIMGILGDSYSTYNGWIPTENGAYFPANDVTDAKSTWWYLLAEKLKCTIGLNDSWSGSTICTDVRPELPEDSSFVKRIDKSFGSQNTLKIKPDLLIIYGGTNDCWLSRTEGDIITANWTEDDLKNIVPALCYVFDKAKTYNPGCKIIFVLQNDVVLWGDTLRQKIKKACKEYKIDCVELDRTVEIENSHPTKNGMKTICNFIFRTVG